MKIFHFLFHLFKHAHCEKELYVYSSIFQEYKRACNKRKYLFPTTMASFLWATSCTYHLFLHFKLTLCCYHSFSLACILFFFFPLPVSQCSFGFWLVFLIAPFNCPFNYLNSLDFVSSLRLETSTGIVRYYLNIFLKLTKRDSMYQNQLPHLLSFLLVLKYL